MDKNQKLLKRLSKKEFTAAQEALDNLFAGNHNTLNIKKLTGQKDLYRVRVQNIRIIFLLVFPHFARFFYGIV